MCWIISVGIFYYILNITTVINVATTRTKL